MTFEEFNKLPVGTKIMLSEIEFEKISNGTYGRDKSTISFYADGYFHTLNGVSINCHAYNILKYIKIISIPNNSQILKEKIQKISQEIDSRSNEKVKLELELEKILKAERENILNNLVPNEWYKIQHVRGNFNTVKFIKVKSSGVGFGEVVTGISVNSSPFYIVISDIKIIEHIKGAKEAEEIFLKMLEG